MQLDTAEGVRDFLRLCLDPGPRLPSRTVSQLVTIMPEWLAEQVAAHTPELAPLRDEATAAQTAAATALETYTEALHAWIYREPHPNPTPVQPDPTPSVPIPLHERPDNAADPTAYTSTGEQQ